MSGHCNFCGIWHSGSCCHPGRTLGNTSAYPLPAPAPPSGAEPRSGETPPGAGADLLARLDVREWMERFLNPSNHDISVARAQYGPNTNVEVLRAQARGQIASDFEDAIATELRRLAAEVERLRAQLAQVNASYQSAMTTDWPLIRATSQAAAEQMRLQAAYVCDAFVPPSHWPGDSTKEMNASEQDAADDASIELAARIMALPLPTPDLDAIREAARVEGADHTQPCGCQCYAEGVADGFKQGRSSIIDLAQQEAERRGAERAAKASWRLVKIHPKGWANEDVEALHVQAIMRELFPAAPEVSHGNG